MSSIFTQYLTLKNLLGLCCLSFFCIQPWDRHLSDSFWLLLALISLAYVVIKKYQNYDFNTPTALRNLFWVFTLFPTVSIISYLLSPLEALTPKALEPETRWLLIIPMIITMRDKKIGANWILAFLMGYAINTFLTATQETHYLTRLDLRASGDENAVPYGMYSATIGLMLIAYFISPYINQLPLEKYKMNIIRLTILTCASLALIATFASATRAAILLIPVVTAILFASHFNFKKASIGLSLLLCFGAIFISTQSNSGFEHRLMSIKKNTVNFFITNDHASKLTSEGERLEQWRESICIFKKHPLLGTGPRSFRYAHHTYGGNNHCDATQGLYKDGGSYQAHSVYFNTLSTLGLAGMITMVILFISLLNICNVSFKNHNKKRNLGGLLLIVVISSHAINGLTLDLLFMNHVTDKNLIAIVLPLLLIFFNETTTKISARNKY